MKHDAHIEPSRHTTREVDKKLETVEDKVADKPGAGSPAIKPNRNLDEDGKPDVDTPDNPRL